MSSYCTFINYFKFYQSAAFKEIYFFIRVWGYKETTLPCSFVNKSSLTVHGANGDIDKQNKWVVLTYKRGEVSALFDFE